MRFLGVSENWSVLTLITLANLIMSPRIVLCLPDTPFADYTNTRYILGFYFHLHSVF